jgi:hypothetical protein
MASPRKPSQGRLVLDDSGGGAVSAGGLPEVPVKRPGERKPVNLPREALEPLGRYAVATGQEVDALAEEAVAIYMRLMADEGPGGDLERSRTCRLLEWLKVEMDTHVGHIVRVSTAIGCRLMEALSDRTDGRSLFDELAGQAEAQHRSVADLVAEYVRTGLDRDRKRGGPGESSRSGPREDA